ncbi:MAG: hypothetical protein KDD47_28300, partial [Acidobacteria bacterium]|nr:hypothetical protein [Acidobacteriota bacterium]
LALGLGASLYNFDLEAKVDFFVPQAGAFFDPFSDYSPAALSFFSKQEGSDEDLALTAGFLLDLNERWALGGVFRQGPEFKFGNVVRSKFFESDDPPVFCQAEDFPRCVVIETTGTFAVPDVLGLGLSFRPTDRLLLALDVDQVRYSELNRNAIDVFDFGDDGAEGQALLTIDDATEVHFGIEYVVPELRFPLALRFGGWLDPDHRQRYDGPTDTPGERDLALSFPAGNDEIHVAAGVGLVFSESFQIDAAVDVSDTVSTGSLSAVYRF